MAVRPAKEEIASRRSTIGTDGERTYERTFIVEMTNHRDDPAQALTAANIPRRFTPYITQTHIDYGALVTSVKARNRRNSPFHVDVVVSYSSKRDDEEEEQNDDPLKRPPKIRWSWETVQVPILGNRDQNAAGDVSYSGAILNSAGEPFNPPPTKEESRPQVTIVRNEASYSVSRALDYQDAVNSDTFDGIKPRQAKMRNIGAEWVTENDTTYVIVTYVLAFRRDTWDTQLLDAGTHYLTVAGGTTYERFKRNGIAYIGLLASDGTKLASTDPPNIITIKPEKQQPFAPLNLPLIK